MLLGPIVLWCLELFRMKMVEAITEAIRILGCGMSFNVRGRTGKHEL